jgi:hypothetical protein
MGAVAHRDVAHRFDEREGNVDLGALSHLPGERHVYAGRFPCESFFGALVSTQRDGIGRGVARRRRELPVCAVDRHLGEVDPARYRFLVAQEYPEATELFELLPDGGRRTLRLMGQFIGPPPR